MTTDIDEICVDTVGEIIDVAVDVLRDYGADAGDSRIERLARWVIYNLGVQVNDRSAGSHASIVYTEDNKMAAAHFDCGVRLHGQIQTYDHVTRWQSPEQARQLATALLICADRADES